MIPHSPVPASPGTGSASQAEPFQNLISGWAPYVELTAHATPVSSTVTPSGGGLYLIFVLPPMCRLT